MLLNANYPAAPSASDPTASEALASSSAREDPQDNSAYCLITRDTPSVEANGDIGDIGVGSKQPHSNQAIPVPTSIDEPYRRLWALVSVALLDLALTSWFYLRSTKASLVAAPFSNPAQKGITRLVGLGYLRSVTYITIGLSKRWRKTQLFIIAGLVVTLLGVLWEVNLAVQWRGWDQKQLGRQGQGKAAMMIDFAVFGKVVRVRITNLAQYLCTAIYFIHLHLSPLSVEDIHILQTQPSRLRNRYTAQQARIRQRSTTIGYTEDDVHITRSRDICSADQQFPNYGCLNPPSTPTHRTAASVDTSSRLSLRQASTSASNKSRYLHPLKYTLALPDTANFSPSPSPTRKSVSRRADKHYKDLKPGRDLLASSWGSPTRHGAYTSTPDSKRRRTCGSRGISSPPGLQPGSYLMAGSDGEDVTEGTTSGTEDGETASTEEEGARGEDGDESDRTEEAHDEEDEGDASSISSDEIVDMPPPRSTRTIRSPISSPLINGSKVRPSSCFTFPMREGQNPSSPLSPSSSGFNVGDEEQGGPSSTISTAGTGISASLARTHAVGSDDGGGEDMMDTSLQLPQGETRLEKALRVRWIRGRRARHQRRWHDDDDDDDGGGGSQTEGNHSGFSSPGGRSRSQAAAAGRGTRLSDAGETPGAGYGTF